MQRAFDTVRPRGARVQDVASRPVVEHVRRRILDDARRARCADLNPNHLLSKGVGSE